MGKGSGSCTSRAPLAFGGNAVIQSTAESADTNTLVPEPVYQFNAPLTPGLTAEQRAQLFGHQSIGFAKYCSTHDLEPEEAEMVFDELVAQGLMTKNESYKQTDQTLDRTISYIPTSYAQSIKTVGTMRKLDNETVAVLEAFVKHRKFDSQAAIAYHSGISRKAVSGVLKTLVGQKWFTHHPKTSHWSPSYYGLSSEGQGVVTAFGHELGDAQPVEPIDVPHGGFVNFPELADGDINEQARQLVVNSNLEYRGLRQRLGLNDDNQAAVFDPLVTAGYLRKDYTTYHSVDADGLKQTSYTYYHKTEAADNERGENTLNSLGLAAQEILFYYASTSPTNTVPRAVPQPDFIQKTGLDADAVRTGFNQLLAAGYAHNVRNWSDGYGVGLNPKGRWLLQHVRRLANS